MQNIEPELEEAEQGELEDSGELEENLNKSLSLEPVEKANELIRFYETESSKAKSFLTYDLYEYQYDSKVASKEGWEESSMLKYCCYRKINTFLKLFFTDELTAY